MTLSRHLLPVLLVGTLLGGRAAWALPDFDAGDVSALTTANIESLIETVAIGTDHRAYMTARPMGVTGIDAGLEVTLFRVPSAFLDAMTAAGIPTGVPALLPVPRLNLHKGFPLGLDLGFSFVTIQGNRLLGAEIQWAFLRTKPLLPFVALRTSATLSRLYFMNTRTYKADLLASKGMGPLLEPYGGFGLQFSSGDLNVPVGVPGGLQLTVAGQQSSTDPHVFLGLAIKMVLFRVTVEYDYSFAGIQSYGLKASIGI